MTSCEEIRWPNAFTYDECGKGTEASTVFPSPAGGFPAATFFSLNDAISYGMSFAPAVGVHVCPALSFGKHYPNTVRP